jgi:hypothetical protein
VNSRTEHEAGQQRVTRRQQQHLGVRGWAAEWWRVGEGVVGEGTPNINAQSLSNWQPGHHTIMAPNNGTV